MIQYRFPITGLKQSTNKIYAGQHWGKRQKFKDSVLDYVAGFCRPVQAPRSYPVEISYRFLFRSRAIDTLNTAYLAKTIEDSFRAVGILEDDDPKHVARTVLEVVAADKKKNSKAVSNSGRQTDEKNEDYVEITIKEI